MEKLGKATVLSLLSLAACQPARHAPTVPLVVVAGQSNAVGYGQRSPSALPPGIAWRGRDFPRGIGPAFAERYIETTGAREIVVVQCAVGGTSIGEWAPGGKLYEECIDMVKAAKKEFGAVEVTAILFWQGEADTQMAGVPWAHEFANLVHAWRSDFRDGLIPVVFCQIRPNAFRWCGDVQREQASISLPWVRMVRVPQDAAMTDALHVGPLGLREVGLSMAHTVIQMEHELKGVK